MSQVVATTSVLFIAICLHMYMKWSNEYLIKFVFQEYNLPSQMLEKILQFKIQQFSINWTCVRYLDRNLALSTFAFR